MISPARTPTFEVRHVQLARALFAAIAMIMITFSTDHSALVGMAVFSGFAIATGLVFLLSVWLVYPAGARWPSILLGIVTLVAGMLGGLGPLRTITGFFTVVIVWAIIAGIIETVAGARARSDLRRPEGASRTFAGIEQRPVGSAGSADAPRTTPAEARDALVIGILTIVLGLALLVVPTGYALQYTIEDAQQTFTLTGIIIGVGVFGGYAAIVAVYLGIAGLSPRAPIPVITEAPTSVSADQKDPA